MVILEADTIQETEMKGKKFKKMPQENEKRNLIEGINTWADSSALFLKWTREELQLMDQKKRKLMTMPKTLHRSDDIERLYVSRKHGVIGLACIEDSVDTSIRRLEDYIKKYEGRLITVTRNINNARINRTTITRKQNLEEKRLYGYFKRQESEISNEKIWTQPRKRNLKRETLSLLIAA